MDGMYMSNSWSVSQEFRQEWMISSEIDVYFPGKSRNLNNFYGLWGMISTQHYDVLGLGCLKKINQV